jgi:hypothetical protein
MRDLDYEAALKALQEAITLSFLIRVQISVLLTPHWASALVQHPPEECLLDLVDRTMQSLGFTSGTIASAMQRCNIAIRRLTQFGARSRGGVPC